MAENEALQVDIPAEHKRRLKVIAAQRGTTLTALIREMVQKYISQVSHPSNQMVRTDGPFDAIDREYAEGDGDGDSL